jgi:hypothetical protein
MYSSNNNIRNNFNILKTVDFLCLIIIESKKVFVFESPTHHQSLPETTTHRNALRMVETNKKLTSRVVIFKISVPQNHLESLMNVQKKIMLC